MLVYTLILIPLTIIPVLYGGLGLFYGASAVLLGGWLLRGVIRLLRSANITQPAWSLYRDSLLYLALLFCAMMVDGFVPGARLGAPAPFVLQGPNVAAAAPAVPLVADSPVR
jgi:protoheme IX farnesyltransferase